MEQVLIVVFSSFCGGLVQAVTGFGGAVIIMIFLPLILNMTAAPALSDVITMTLSFSMFWRYRKSVRFKSIVIPAAVYLISSTLAIHGSAFIDAGKLKGVFGVFLIILSVYFFGFSGKLSVKPTLFMKFGCRCAGWYLWWFIWNQRTAGQSVLSGRDGYEGRVFGDFKRIFFIYCHF